MKKAALYELCAIAGGIPAPKETSLSGDIPFVRMRELGNAHLSTNFVPSDEFLTKHDEKAFSAKIIQPGATLFPRSGSVHLNHRALLQTPAAIVSHIAALIPNEGTDSEFLYHLLTSYDMTEIMTQTTGLNMIKFGQLKDVIFTVPDTKPEQAKIAEILTLVDRSIEQTEALIAKQQRIKAGLIQDLLTKGIDEHGNIRSEATHTFKDSPLGRIPVEWGVDELATRADVRGGKRLPAGHKYAESDTGFRYLQTTDFIGKALDYLSLHSLHPSTFTILKRYEITNGQVFISIAGVNLGVAGVFRPNNADRVILTENAAKISVHGDDVPQFIAAQINGPIAQKQIEAEKGLGAGVPKLALCRIQTLVFPWPSPSEQQQILERLNSLESVQDVGRFHLIKLQKLKNGLMNDLLTGKVRVTKLLGSQTSQE